MDISILLAWSYERNKSGKAIINVMLQYTRTSSTFKFALQEIWHSHVESVLNIKELRNNICMNSLC
jgi:hypothetical protein